MYFLQLSFILCVVQRRIQKEISTMINSPPPGTRLCDEQLDTTGEFVVELLGANGTLYAGEQFFLKFKFGERYPFESPQVINCLLKTDLC